MDIQLDIDGLKICNKRFKKHNGYSRGPMSAEIEKRVMTLAKNDQILRRAVSAYFAEEANYAEKIFAKHVVDYNMDSAGLDFEWALEKIHDEIPITLSEIYGRIDTSKKMHIVSLYANGSEGSGGGEFRAKYRYNPKSDKLSRIG